jgi:putative transposase
MGQTLFSDRMFLAVVLSVARTGIAWRNMPAEFGHWDAGYNRFRRWESHGIWRQLWQQLQREEFTVAKALFIDSTICGWAVLGVDFPPKSMPAA